jgi:hypothetical protein
MEGNTEAVNLKISGKRSYNNPSVYVPSPDPVPPPKEWIKKKDCIESHCSTALLTL